MLQVSARNQALSRTDTMGEKKTKRMALLSIIMIVAAEVVDVGSDVVVYIHTVAPQADIIGEVVSTSFVPAYLICLLLSLLVSSVVLLSRVGFLYCIAQKRGQVQKEEEYLLITLNELCGIFVLIFEDTPFIVLNCILIYTGHLILGCPRSDDTTTTAIVSAGSADGIGGMICDEDAADQRLRELMISFSISAV